MARYILQFTGDSKVPTKALDQIQGCRNLKVLDASHKLVLVEADNQTLQGLMADLPDWTLSPEQTIQLPDTRRKIRTTLPQGR